MRLRSPAFSDGSAIPRVFIIPATDKMSPLLLTGAIRRRQPAKDWQKSVLS
jgi:hypothetical protein